MKKGNIPVYSDSIKYFLDKIESSKMKVSFIPDEINIKEAIIWYDDMKIAEKEQEQKKKKDSEFNFSNLNSN